MLLKLTLILSFAILVQGVCDKTLRETVCAVLYGKENCEDAILPNKRPLEISEGEEDLSFLRRDDTQSIKVRRGCTLRGYNRDPEGAGISTTRKAAEVIEGKADFVVVRASEAGDGWANLAKKETIKSVSCRCENRGNCPEVPPYLCAIAYDKVGCEQKMWSHPLEIPTSEKINLGLITSYDYRKSIESVSVRKGCIFKGFREADLNPALGQVTITAPITGDLHYDLKAEMDLPRGIESLSCTCS